MRCRSESRQYCSKSCLRQLSIRLSPCFFVSDGGASREGFTYTFKSYTSIHSILSDFFSVSIIRGSHTYVASQLAFKSHCNKNISVALYPEMSLTLSPR